LIEKIALNSLPPKRFELRTLRQVTVHKNSHVLLSVDKHHYSVPYQLIGKKVKLSYSRSVVEVYDNYRLVATHARVKSPGNYTTERTHLPLEHQYMFTWSPEQYITRARAIDPAVELYIRKVLDKKVYPQQAYKSCDGILSFDKKIGRERLINACKRTMISGTTDTRLLKISSNVALISMRWKMSLKACQHMIISALITNNHKHSLNLFFMNQILEKMKQMKLAGMARAFEQTLESGKNERYTPDEMITHLVESEWDERYNRKLDRTVKMARFRYKSSLEELTIDDGRLDRNQVLRLATCDFVKRKENIIITGSTGIGKSYLASALGHQACSMGYRVLYQHSTKLFARLKIAKADGTILKELLKIEKQHILLIDDFGIQPLDAQSRSVLMEIIEDRHGKGSTIITSQVPVSLWHDVIGENTIADAILDRIVHDAHRVEMTGESMRKKKTSVEEDQNDNVTLIN
jgi:DNA replication protein DnaC